jgi:pyrroline-5-carboxylate reductase
MKKVDIIGMGTMGSAIHGLLQDDFAVRGIGHQANIAVVREADIAILAVKPQSFSELAAELRPYLDRQTIISIMAGVTMHSLTESLGTDRIVRSMPNLALKIGRSTTAWYTESPNVDLDATSTIFDTWGMGIRLQQEKDFHILTAIAGSGPGLVAEFANQLIRAGTSQGLHEPSAREAVIGMMEGAAALLRAGGDPRGLVGQVASRGGTTEAALAVFNEQGFGHIVGEAVAAAAERSRELGRSLKPSSDKTQAYIDQDRK